MDEFNIVTLMRSVMWIVLSIFLLYAARDYFKVNTAKSVHIRHAARAVAWSLILLNVIIFGYILMNMLT